MKISYWTRIAIVASIIWFGLMLMAVNIWTDFHFFNPRSGHGPDRALIVTLIGLGIIWVARIGIAWISQAK
jgi:hypothetical protein